MIFSSHLYFVRFLFGSFAPFLGVCVYQLSCSLLSVSNFWFALKRSKIDATYFTLFTHSPKRTSSSLLRRCPLQHVATVIFQRDADELLCSSENGGLDFVSVQDLSIGCRAKLAKAKAADLIEYDSITVPPVSLMDTENSLSPAEFCSI